MKDRSTCPWGRAALYENATTFSLQSRHISVIVLDAVSTCFTAVESDTDVQRLTRTLSTTTKHQGSAATRCRQLPCDEQSWWRVEKMLKSSDLVLFLRGKEENYASSTSVLLSTLTIVFLSCRTALILCCPSNSLYCGLHFSHASRNHPLYLLRAS